MIQARDTRLFLDPWNVFVEAQIVSLTPEMADSRIHNGWWDEECLKADFGLPLPIDRHWNWNEMSIEYEGRPLASEKVAILAGADNPVQGAMMISVDPVPSVLQPGQQTLFLELLFTAPRNRVNLRKDGRHLLRAVGLELLTWGTWFSRQKNCSGQLLLDSSPDQVAWYQKRGLQILDLKPIIFEGVEYTPMELSVEAADELLRNWNA